MTDSVLVIRIAGLGLGDLADSRAIALTSRPIQYGANAKIEGVVTDLGEQLSSEISLFGAIGSDTTTTVSVLANAETMPLLLARGKIPVKDADGASVVTTFYIQPTPADYADTVIAVSDTINISVDDLIRIATTVFRVISVDSSSQITGRRYYDCAGVPIPMVRSGSSVGVEGQTVYNVNASKPSGGAESLPITISTVPFGAATAAAETVIFRGIVNKVALDTSAGGQNQIRIECGSLISYLRASSFAPPRGQTIINGFLPDEANRANWPTDTIQTGINTGFAYNPKLYGPLFIAGQGVAETAMPLIQFRKDAAGGIGLVTSYASYYYGNDIYGTPQNGYLINYQSQYTFSENGSGMAAGGYLMSFRDSYYCDRPDGPELQTTVFRWGQTGVKPPGITENTWRKVYDANNPEVVGETCFVSTSLKNLFVDLILGTFAADLQMGLGCRSASEAAWLPFNIDSISDLIDISSLNQMLGGLTDNDMPPFSNGLEDTNLKILPYKHDEAKTVFDILEEILKRIGGFLIYDAGRLVFGRWAGTPDTPIVVNDSALASPEIRLSFDRNNCVQAVNLAIATDVYAGAVTKVDVPIANIDLGIGAQGKTLKLGHFGVFGLSEANINLSGSGLWSNGVELVLRFSQAAATVEVQYRDAVADLRVGQQVALSSAYLPNAYGGLGVTAATGMVLKAARSWKTPTTSYSILLSGYLNPINRLSVISPAGRAISKPSAGKVAIAPNDFTNAGADTATGAPATDAAAFDYALQLSNTGAIPVQLLDEYGTPYSPPVTDYLTEVAGNVLTCGNVAIEAKATDIIVLDSSFVMPNIAAQWSAYLASADGRVQGEIAFAYKWVR